MDLLMWWLTDMIVTISLATSGVRLTLALVLEIMTPIVFAYSLADVIWASTPGKWILKLRILDQDGGPAPRSRLLTRWLAKYLLLLSGPMMSLLLASSGKMDDPTVLLPVMALSGLVEVTFAACFLFALGPRKQTLYDVLCRTAVYRVPAPSGATAAGSGPATTSSRSPARG